MGRKKNVKKGTVKSRRNISVKRKRTSAGDWTGGIVQIYLTVMLGILPLCYHKGYSDIGATKYIFFRTATLIMLAMLSIELASNRILGTNKIYAKNRKNHASVSVREKMKKWLDGLSFTDRAVLIYMILAIFSWLLSEDRSHAWIGATGWYMGLLTQLLLVGIYFAVSRFYIGKEYMLWVMAGSSAVVFLISYLHRFSIDPLGIRNGRFSNISFLGTIGNANHYSAYICVVLPVIMGIYMLLWNENTQKAKIRRRLELLVMFLGFCSAVTQNSDSVYAGLAAAFLFLLWFALESGIMWKRYIELCLVAVTAAKITGILQILFPERVPALQPLSFLLTKGQGGWLVLAMFFIIYGVTCRIQKQDVSTAAFSLAARRFRKVFYALLALAAICVPVVIWLATIGKIPVAEGFWQQTHYLVFDWGWGSSRGSIWMLCAGAFMGYPFFRKLFGCGPDMLGRYLKSYHGETLYAMWGKIRVENAHNEWFTAVMDYGILGGAAYMAIFVGMVVRIIRNRKHQPVLLAAGASILAYMAHNSFCFQQAVGAPLIFIVIGGAEKMIRRGVFEKEDN